MKNAKLIETTSTGVKIYQARTKRFSQTYRSASAEATILKSMGAFQVTGVGATKIFMGEDAQARAQAFALAAVTA